MKPQSSMLRIGFRVKTPNPHNIIVPKPQGWKMGWRTIRRKKLNCLNLLYNNNNNNNNGNKNFHGKTAPSVSGPRCRGFMITLRHTSVGRTSLDEWSDRSTDNTQHSWDRHPCPPAGFEISAPASGRPKTYALYGEATGISSSSSNNSNNNKITIIIQMKSMA